MDQIDPKIKIKTDRSSIKAIKPNTEVTKPEEWMSPWGEKIKICKKWTERNRMVMNVVSHLIIEHFKQQGQQERVFLYPDIETVKNDEKYIHEKGPHPDPLTIKIEASTFRNVTGKDYMTSKDILELFVDTANTSAIVTQPILIKVLEPIKKKNEKKVVQTKNGSKQKNTIMLREVSREKLMDYDWLTMPFEVGWDRNNTNPTTFEVRLTTIFARVLVHNLRAKGYSEFDRRVYECSGGAQNLYSDYIVVNEGLLRKRGYVDAYEDEVVSTLDMHTHEVKRTIVGYIEELKSLNIIYSHEIWTDIYGKRFYRLYTKPKELGVKKPAEIGKESTKDGKVSDKIGKESNKDGFCIPDNL